MAGSAPGVAITPAARGSQIKPRIRKSHKMNIPTFRPSLAPYKITVLCFTCTEWASQTYSCEEGEETVKHFLCHCSALVMANFVISSRLTS